MSKSRRRPGRLGRRAAVAVLAVAALTATMGLVSPVSAVAAEGVEPSHVELTLGPGQSSTVAKVVHTAPVPPNPDIVFLADVTTSMGPAVGNVQANAANVLNQITSEQPSAQYAVAEYVDQADPQPPFTLNTQRTADTSAAQAGIANWTPLYGGGNDAPEDFINALFQIATGAVDFRTGGSRIVVWFGDSSSHDPSEGHTEAAATLALQQAGIRVVAINVGPTPGQISDGLNAKGQAARIANATGGVFLDHVGPGQVAQAILDGIHAIPVTVTPTPFSCAPELSVSFHPASRTVDSGTDASFQETIGVSPGAAAGTYNCSVDFKVDGTSLGYVQTIVVHVPGLKINDVTVTEGNSGTTPANFTVSLSAPSPSPVTVHYATSNGTATSGSDYIGTSGDLTFMPGQTTKTAPVPVVGDVVDEPNETFFVDLSAPSGAAIVDGHGVGTIIDDDRNGTFSCRASAIRIASIDPVVANDPESPCKDDHRTLAQANLSSGLISVKATGLDAVTDQTPNDLTTAPPAAGDNASAKATTASVTITTVATVIKVDLIESNATVQCVAGPGGLTPKMTGSSKVTGLSIDGVPVTVGSGPLDVPLVVGTLHLNNTATTANSITQRAVWLDTVLTDVVVSESKADFHGSPAHPSGNPCQA